MFQASYKTLVIAVVALLIGLGSQAQAECTPQTFDVIMATPFSSRVNRAQDPVKAILSHSIQVGSRTIPSGTELLGKIAKIQPSTPKATGRLLLKFTRFKGQDLGQINAVPATQDGWLGMEDANSVVWSLSPLRSTRLLNDKIQKRLGADPAVWAQILGIQENMIPNPSSDEFMYEYNARDVMAGVGDRLKLRMECP